MKEVIITFKEGLNEVKVTVEAYNDHFNIRLESGMDSEERSLAMYLATTFINSLKNA